MVAFTMLSIFLTLTIWILVFDHANAIHAEDNFELRATESSNDIFPFETSTNGSASVDIESSDPMHIFKRACPAGYRQCRYSGRCCPLPADACCPDGTCIIEGQFTCCPGGLSCRPGRQCCETGCAPDTSTCCPGGGHCPPGKVCARRGSQVGCCPEAGCYVYRRVIYWYYYVYWYVEWWVYVEVDVRTSTVGLTSSTVEASSTATVRANDEDEATAAFESLSESVQDAATGSTPDLAGLTTETSSSTAFTVSRTPSPTETETAAPSTMEPEPPTFSDIESLPGSASTFSWSGTAFIAAGAFTFAITLLL